MSDLDASRHEAFADWDAAYVLGSLSPSDRRAYEQHQTGCSLCREAAAELADMPGLLSVMSHEEAGQVFGQHAIKTAGSPPADVAETGLRSRRRRRAFTIAAAVALLAGGTALGGLALSGQPSAQSKSQVSTRSSAPPSTQPSVTVPPAQSGSGNIRTFDLRPVGGEDEDDALGQLVVTPQRWGTEFDWSWSAPAGQGDPAQTGGTGDPVTYDLVLVGSDGTRTVAGSWIWMDGEETLMLDASSSVPIDDVERVEITLVGDDTPVASASLS